MECFVVVDPAAV